MPSCFRLIPGLEEEVIARAPATDAPNTIFIAANSLSDCINILPSCRSCNNANDEGGIMNMLGLEVLVIVALILGILSLFGLSEKVVLFIIYTITVVYFGFLFGAGVYLAAMFIQAVT